MWFLFSSWLRRLGHQLISDLSSPWVSSGRSYNYRFPFCLGAFIFHAFLCLYWKRVVSVCIHLAILTQKVWVNFLMKKICIKKKPHYIWKSFPYGHVMHHSDETHRFWSQIECHLLFARSWEDYKISVSHFPACAMAYCLGYHYDRMRKGIERPSKGAWKLLSPPLPRSSPNETDITIRQSRSNWHFYYWWSCWITTGILGNGYLSKK